MTSIRRSDSLLQVEATSTNRCLEAMAYRRSSLALLCVCSVLLVFLMADVTVAVDVQEQQPATGVTGTDDSFLPCSSGWSRFSDLEKSS